MKALWIALLALTSAGCGDTTDPVVAEIGDYVITATRLRTFVEGLPDGLRNQYVGDAARRQYLQSLIDRHLLLTEARALGFDTTRAVDRAASGAVDSRAIALYRARHMTPKASVSEEEVRRVFAEEGYDRERKLGAILVKTRAEIETVLSELRGGRSFAEVADAHSLDERSAGQEGELGFVDRNLAGRLHVPLDVFASLPLGEVSTPLPAGKSWHVVRFSEEREVAYNRSRPTIEERLFRKRLAQVEAEHFEQLKESFHAVIEPAAFQQMLSAAAERDAGALASNTTALYVHDEGRITVAAAWEALVRVNAVRALSDSSRALESLERIVLRIALLREAARRDGLYADPDVERLGKSVREDALLETVRKTAPVDTPSDAEVWQYYDEHPEFFHHEESVRIQELLLASAGEAHEVKAQIAAGAPFADFAGRNRREGALDNRVHLHFHPRDKFAYPHLVPAILEADIGQLTGPISVEGGYSLFRVESRDPGVVEPFEKVRRQARALILRERESRALAAQIQSLRDRHASRIKIHQDRLADALPDDLVGGA
jgi:parvulin-like peptidyl-prolyl isomerase